MRAWLIGALSACSFQPGVISGSDAAFDTSDSDGVSDLCYGTSGFAIVCLAEPATSSTQLASGNLDTDSSSSCVALQPQSSRVCVVAGTSVNLSSGATVAAFGTRPLVLLATTGEITIDGTLDVASHRGGKTGPAANGLPCTVGTNPTAGGGGQGGSFGSSGGAGGDRDGSSNSGGLAAGMSTPTQLLGGCPGAEGAGSSGSAGSGGGAVLLISSDLTITGAIDASGSGGWGAQNNDAGGGGGGAGGLVVLDAPTISVSGSIFAHGGGGGGGGGGCSGGDGSSGDDPSASGDAGGGSGGFCAAGRGGNGNVNAAAGSRGSAGSNFSDGGGGGGGGAGVIRVFQHVGSLGGTVSPAPT